MIDLPRFFITEKYNSGPGDKPEPKESSTPILILVPRIKALTFLAENSGSENTRLTCCDKSGFYLPAYLKSMSGILQSLIYANMEIFCRYAPRHRALSYMGFSMKSSPA